ncbi:MAG: hypothetical protein U0791_07900 [Gemmataceae bacterium]
MRIIASATLLAAACSGGVASAQQPNLSGRWSGHWESQTTGHTGPLNGRFKQVDDTHYKVVFTGRFFKVIPFRYSQKLEVVGGDGENVLLSGSSRLPGFGTYEYSANATSRDFHATYQSRRDRGAFILRR